MKSLWVINHGNWNTYKNTTRNEALLKDNTCSKLLALVATYSLVITILVTDYVKIYLQLWRIDKILVAKWYEFAIEQ